MGPTPEFSFFFFYFSFPSSFSSSRSFSLSLRNDTSWPLANHRLRSFTGLHAPTGRVQMTAKPQQPVGRRPGEVVAQRWREAIWSQILGVQTRSSNHFHRWFLVSIHSSQLPLQYGTLCFRQKCPDH